MTSASTVDVAISPSGEEQTTAMSLASPWITEDDCRLADFQADLLRATDPADYPHANAVVDQVLVYSGETLRETSSRALKAELIRALLDGPGVFVVENAFEARIVDAATEAFDALIAEQHARG